jgi:hypothetical protein
MKITQKNKTQIKNFAFSAKKILCSCTDEETAFIWFSRITAVHYMKINGYIPEKLVGLGFDSLCRALSAYLPEFFYETKAAHSSDAIPLDHIMREISKIDNDVFIENPEVIGEIYSITYPTKKSRRFCCCKRTSESQKRICLPQRRFLPPGGLSDILWKTPWACCWGKRRALTFT